MNNEREKYKEFARIRARLIHFLVKNAGKSPKYQTFCRHAAGASSIGRHGCSRRRCILSNEK